MESAVTPLEARKAPYFDPSKGDIQEISVLDDRLRQDVYFPNYQSSPQVQPEIDPCSWQNWIEDLKKLEKNLTWLLKLPYPKFWCQIINNATLQSSVDSYLKQAPRFQYLSWHEDILEVHNAVHRLVFITCIRMATNKESSSDFMTSEYFGNLIYEKYLFDIPKILDICVLYGNETNAPLLAKAVANIFKCQTNYNDDLEQATQTITQIFRNIDEKCGVSYESEDVTSSRRPHRLSEGPQSITSKLSAMATEEFQDVIMYTSDICFTLKRFLVDVYPNACTAFLGNVKYFAHFYSTTMDVLRSTLRGKHFDDLHLRSHLLAHLRVGRSAILAVIHKVINECMLLPALRASEAGDKQRLEQLADDYLHLLSEFIGISIFFHDFMKKMPVLKDVQSLIQVSPSIDEARASFILGSLGSGKSPRSDRPPSLPVDSQESYTAPSNSNKCKNPISTVHSDPEMMSLISTVRDVLPHLEEGYIRTCLLFYDKDYEKTIHALLEGSVPDDIGTRERSSVPLNTSYQMKNDEQSSDLDEEHDCSEVPIPAFLADRKNVFDNDEFDVYENKKVDYSRIHKGKKNKSQEDFDQSRAELKHTYAKYTMVSDEEEIEGNMGLLVIDDCNTYDDEYDDAYDGLGVDANDADDTDDILKRRPFVTPRVFLQKKKEDRDGSSGESEDDTGSSHAPKPDHFIANPAELRAKQEARRRQQQELRNNKRGSNRGQKQKSENSDSKASSAVQRKRKDANKAKVANHSRKFMATKKASKGMGGPV